MEEEDNLVREGVEDTVILEVAEEDPTILILLKSQASTKSLEQVLVCNSLAGEILPLDTPQNETINNFLQLARAINKRGLTEGQHVCEDILPKD